MNREIEYRFYKYNKINIINKLKEIKATQSHTFVKYEFVVFYQDSNKNNYVRLRNENGILTLTNKIHDDIFPIEHQVVVSDFQKTIDFLLSIGLKIKYKFEKLREKWIIENTEIVFDIYPAVQEYMEIESKTIEELEKYCLLFQLDPKQHKSIPLSIFYYNTFGFKNIPANLSFENMQEKLTPLIKKNKNLFEKITNFQKKLL